MTLTEARQKLSLTTRDAVLSYLNSDPAAHTIKGSERNVLRDRVTQARDDLGYRFDSLVYHVSRIVEAHERAVSYARENIGEDVIIRMNYMIREQEFLFDDMMFGAMSYFDYLATLVAVAMHGNEQIEWTRWSNVKKFADGETVLKISPNRLAGTCVAEAITGEDERWIREMYGYRSKIIHYGTGKTDASAEWTERVGEAAVFTNFGVYVPSEVVTCLRLGEDSDRTTIRDAAVALVSNVLFSAEIVLHAVQAEMDQRYEALKAERIARDRLDTS